jgi:uncharacterized LabA/DUF88 family protein
VHREKKEKLIAYIDGFNFYYGLREKGWRKYYWLNLTRLVKNLLKANQDLVQTKYFTARISAGDDNVPLWLRKKMEAKRRRQATFLEALATLNNFQIYEGHYLGKTVSCKKCGNTWNTHEEKMTDVCIATELLVDAFQDAFDTALIISGDSDLVPPINAVKEKFPSKRIVIAFPPARSSLRLRQVASAYFTISEAKLRKGMFSDKVTKSDGFVLKRPEEWSKNR